MSVVAAISKRTLTFSLVEMLAGNLSEGVLVFLHQVIFVWPCVYHVVAGNDHVRSLTTDWTSSEVLFCSAFVVGGAPSSYALETKSVVARVKDAKLFSFCEDGLQTNLALSVVFFNVSLFFG
jgi:hypothetical protein